MLRRAIHLLAKSKGATWVNKASVWPRIKRLDPAFSFKDHGFTSFSEMLKTLDAVVESKKGDKDHLNRPGLSRHL
ncbi:OST-HTH/LOTUS domain-containing protein [Ralstonia pseudosolanacearum]|uniref:OST-HTH/LOTUS domain-containing protein n=1 Tax=Ralstonia pseudosolanacearum TaxID=1310165 RepID=UPI003CFD1BF5